jgi:tetraacyldisaccharide 4'-kinase
MIKPDTYRAIISGQRRDVAAVCARGLLGLAELPYCLAVAARNRRYDSGRLVVKRMEVPVVSVGNITLGGTGKTPMVAWLASWFHDRGIRVALVSRGYRAGAAGSNDEWQELAARLPDVPHLQNADRVAAARIAIDELQAQLIVLDDAFQHRRIARDLDLVLIDATEPFGYQHVFPRGMLREPLSGLRRAGAIALTRCNLISTEQREQLHARIRQLAPQAAWLEVAQRPAGLLSTTGLQVSLDQIPSGPLLGFCGIGNPAAFRRTLLEQAWVLDGFRAFPDHHRYDRATIRDLETWVAAHPHATAAICTHKDLVKLRVDRLAGIPLYALVVDLKMLSGCEQLEAMLQHLLQSVPSP